MDALDLPPGGALVDVAEAKKMIQDGRCLCIAGAADNLSKLPKGVWIGGSIPYFMAQDGGETDQNRVFVTEIKHFLGVPKIAFYSESELERVATDAPDNGFSIIIIPAASPTHEEYARNAPNFPDMYMKPIVGWISGVHLDDLNSQTPSVANGEIGESSTRQAVVMHVELEPDYCAEINTTNLFQPGSGDAITFDSAGFSAQQCTINGATTSLAHYIKEQNIDTRLPLVADYCGMVVNISIKSVEDNQVEFYAPVFDGIEYRFAEPVKDYVSGFQNALPTNSDAIQFSCNCILNYLYCELQGQNVAIKGPMTFGEVAYQLLNQTMVYLTVEKV